MARLFSMFPAGRAGVALLTLRLSIAAAASLHLWRHPQTFTHSWFFPLFSILTLLVCVGFLTPFVSTLYCLLEAAVWTGAASDPAGLILLISDPVVLALLGPGAYSVDARLFGRRVIVLPGA